MATFTISILPLGYDLPVEEYTMVAPTLPDVVGSLTDIIKKIPEIYYSEHAVKTVAIITNLDKKKFKRSNRKYRYSFQYLPINGIYGEKHWKQIDEKHHIISK